MKQPPASDPIGIYAAQVIARHLQSLQVEFPGVRANQDLEAVHRTRVATRRLRAAFTIFDDRLPTKKKAAWFKEFRSLARSLGAARDADVQIIVLSDVLKNLPDPLFSPGVRRMLLRFRQHRTRLQDKVLLAVDEFEQSAAVAQLNQYLPPLTSQILPKLDEIPVLTQLACQMISARMAEFLAFEADLPYPERVTQLHLMRIAGKRLRYTMETFAPLYPNELKQQLQIMRQAQDALGTIHDCDLWDAVIMDFVEKEAGRIERYFGNVRPLKRLLPGFTYFQENCQQVRQNQYEKFVSDWQAWDADNVWERLLEIVRTPLQLA